MPELPEVETVVRGLRPVLPGRTIVSVRFGKTDFIDDPVALAELLPGKRIASVQRMGKFIRVELAPADEQPRAVVPTQGRADLNAHTSLETGVSGSAPLAAGYHLIVHLGMTGRLHIRAPGDPVVPHTHAFFELDDGRELRYTDIRRFGRISLLPHDSLEQFSGKLGEDALEIGAAAFHRRLTGRRARIKALLLDQRVFRGIGNIYADESLWQARIHPARLAAALMTPELVRLRHAIHRVLRAAIRLRGSSISDFVDADGNPGSYQQRHRVYGREGEPCSRCGSVIRRAIVAGRSSYFCPQCQPAPRVTRARKKAARKKTPQKRTPRKKAPRGRKTAGS